MGWFQKKFKELEHWYRVALVYRTDTPPARFRALTDLGKVSRVSVARGYPNNVLKLCSQVIDRTDAYGINRKRYDRRNHLMNQILWETRPVIIRLVKKGIWGE
jgi:hypothetical protein